MLEFRGLSRIFLGLFGGDNVYFYLEFINVILEMVYLEEEFGLRFRGLEGMVSFFLGFGVGREGMGFSLDR